MSAIYRQIWNTGSASKNVAYWYELILCIIFWHDFYIVYGSPGNFEEHTDQSSMWHVFYYKICPTRKKIVERETQESFFKQFLESCSLYLSIRQCGKTKNWWCQASSSVETLTNGSLSTVPIRICSSLHGSLMFLHHECPWGVRRY